LGYVLPAMDGNIEQRICIKFCVKLNKSAPETLEMLHEAFGEHSLSQTSVCEWHSCFKVSWQLKMANIQGDQAPAKQQKMLRFKTVAEQSMSLQTLLGSVMEFVRRS
jgi:hypothetical protein